MLSDVRSHYGFAKEFRQAGYFEAEQPQQIVKELTSEIRAGNVVALSGILGSGKTTVLRQVHEQCVREKNVLVSKPLAVDKNRITLTVLVNALFYDLGAEPGSKSEKELKIPTQAERRERLLRDLIKKRQNPIALFIDDAHDLHPKTLVGLKRLLEMVWDSGGTIAVVLAGHPKLKNDLRRPTMEEIGGRTAVLDLEGFGSAERLTYLKWLLRQCAGAKIDVEKLISEEALALLAERLQTPLQLQHYLTRAFEESYKIGQKRVGVDIVTTILGRHIDDLEPRLVRQGYSPKILAELLNAKPREITALLRGKLAPARAEVLQGEMLAAGIPL
jgi:type II secretory pathway predicted ATPase ExeA